MGIVVSKDYMVCQTKRNNIEIIDRSTGTIVAYAAFNESLTQTQLKDVLAKFINSDKNNCTVSIAL